MKTSKRRIPYRRGRDTKWQVWWPVLVTVMAYLLGGVGIYVGMSNKLAVQSEQISHLQRGVDTAKSDLKERIDSLERNFSGIQNLIVTMHRNERREQ